MQYRSLGRCYECTKPQMRAGTHIVFSFLCSARCYMLCVLKTTDEVWDPYRVASLVLKSLFCMKGTTDVGWNPYRLVILVQITLVCIHKTTGYIWDSDTFYSSPKFAVLHPKITHEGWDPKRLVILMLGTLFCMQKVTGGVWDPHRHAILVLRSLF